MRAPGRFPVQYRVVRDATPNRVTRPEGPDMLDAFKAAADELIDAGVDGITTTCGFLALYQRELAEHCSVPVATSALLQVPMVARILPKGKRPAILTFSAESLTSRHLEAVGADTATPIYGMPPGSEFQRAIREGDASVPFATLQREVLETAERTVRADASIGALVLECTNLAPYSRDIGPPHRPARVRRGNAGALVPSQPGARAVCAGLTRAGTPRR